MEQQKNCLYNCGRQATETDLPENVCKDCRNHFLSVTFLVKDAYGNVWNDFTMKDYIEYSNEGHPLCMWVDGKWVPNEAWKRHVYWD